MAGKKDLEPPPPPAKKGHASRVVVPGQVLSLNCQVHAVSCVFFFFAVMVSTKKFVQVMFFFWR